MSQTTRYQIPQRRNRQQNNTTQRTTEHKTEQKEDGCIPPPPTFPFKECFRGVVWCIDLFNLLIAIHRLPTAIRNINGLISLIVLLMYWYLFGIYSMVFTLALLLVGYWKIKFMADSKWLLVPIIARTMGYFFFVYPNERIQRYVKSLGDYNRKYNRNISQNVNIYNLDNDVCNTLLQNNPLQISIPDPDRTNIRLSFVVDKLRDSFAHALITELPSKFEFKDWNIRDQRFVFNATTDIQGFVVWIAAWLNKYQQHLKRWSEEYHVDLQM